jgi:hypothetical protein
MGDPFLADCAIGVIAAEACAGEQRRKRVEDQLKSLNMQWEA